MVGQRREPEGDMSFFIHLWLEHRDRNVWRGKATDGDNEHWFEDGNSLLTFIENRLRIEHGVSLPRRRRLR